MEETFFLCFQAFEELERLFSKSGICVAVKEKLTKDSGVAEAFAYDHVTISTNPPFFLCS
jgi:hypothetical protein